MRSNALRNTKTWLALDFSNIESGAWPLIEYLYSDAVYRAKYDSYVQETVEGPFEANYIQQVYAYYATLIAPYAVAERTGYTFLDSSAAFYAALTELNVHASSRSAAAESYLNN